MKFRTRFMMAIVLLLALAFGIGGAMLISASFQGAFAEAKDMSLRSYESVRDTLYVLNSVGDSAGYSDLSNALSQLEGQGSAQWDALTLIRNGEDILFSDNGDALSACSLSVPQSDSCSFTVYGDSGSHYIQILSTIVSDGDDRLLLQARYDISQPFTSRTGQIYMYLKIYAIVVAAGILVSVVVSYALTHRLGRLARAAKRIAGGDLSVRSGIKTSDEIGLLSRQFDSMAESLQRNIEKMEDDMHRQESFMGAFAHEIKTPMTSIIGYADLLRQDSLSPQDSINAAGYIFSEAQRLEKLSFKLLDIILLDKDAVTFKETALEPFVSGIVKAQAPFFKGKGIALSYRCDSGSACFEPDLVKSLIYNLIDNAAKAMDGGGEIELDVSLIPGGCRITVKDNGRGMDHSEISRITEAFYRVDKSRSRRQGGAGLGLNLCQQIVSVHSGTLSFASTPGVGTTVTADLTPKENKDEKA